MEHRVCGRLHSTCTLLVLHPHLELDIWVAGKLVKHRKIAALMHDDCELVALMHGELVVGRAAWAGGHVLWLVLPLLFLGGGHTDSRHASNFLVVDETAGQGPTRVPSVGCAC